MIGFFTIVELMGDDDAAGFKVQAKVKSQMNENIIGVDGIYQRPFDGQRV